MGCLSASAVAPGACAKLYLPPHPIVPELLGSLLQTTKKERVICLFS
jgi:hypothetical protein